MHASDLLMVLGIHYAYVVYDMSIRKKSGAMLLSELMNRWIILTANVDFLSSNGGNDPIPGRESIKYLAFFEYKF